MANDDFNPFKPPGQPVDRDQTSPVSFEPDSESTFIAYSLALDSRIVESIVRHDYDEAKVLAGLLLREGRKVLGDNHPMLFPALVSVGSVLVSNADLTESRQVLEEALALCGQFPNHAVCRPAMALTALAETVRGQGELDYAKELNLQAIRGPLIRDADLMAEVQAHENLARLAFEQEDLFKALRETRRAQDLARGRHKPERGGIHVNRLLEAELQLQFGQTRRARRLMSKVVRWTPKSSVAAFSAASTVLARALNALESPLQAERLLREVITILEPATQKEYLQAWAFCALADALSQQGQAAEAQQVLITARDLLDPSFHRDRQILLEIKATADRRHLEI